jgi:hypothetical protein
MFPFSATAYGWRYEMAESQTSPLPMNRKEVFFTSTVFPMLVCSDNFSEFGKFLNLVGIAGDTSGCKPIQFFTEYNLREAIKTAEDEERFKGHVPETKETPDVMILLEHGGRRLLVAIEAKLFDGVTEIEMCDQLSKQQKLLTNLYQPLCLSPDQIIQVALVPEVLRSEWGDKLAHIRMVTWEKLVSAYKPTCKEVYFVTVLENALNEFEELRSTGLDFSKYADAALTGQEIFDRWNDSSFKYRTMGRDGGWSGVVQGDLVTGRWKATRYQVRTGETPVNRNWFLISRFIQRCQ